MSKTLGLLAAVGAFIVAQLLLGIAGGISVVFGIIPESVAGSPALPLVVLAASLYFAYSAYDGVRS